MRESLHWLPLGFQCSAKTDTEISPCGGCLLCTFACAGLWLISGLDTELPVWLQARPQPSMHATCGQIHGTVWSADRSPDLLMLATGSSTGSTGGDTTQMALLTLVQRQRCE